MPIRRLADLCGREAVEFLNHVLKQNPLLPFLLPLVVVAWALERWLVRFSNWVPLAVAVWAMIQYGKFQRQILVEDFNKKWKQVISKSTPITPMEPCEWLNKLLMDIWPNYIEPKLSMKFSSIIERRLRRGKPKLIEGIKVEDFTLGSCPPSLGLQGIHWSTSGNHHVMCLGFDWKTNDMSILLLAKLRKTLGTVRISVNSLHVKGYLLIIPFLDSRAMFYSFETTPEVKIGVAFGSGGSTILPSTKLPGVSTWLVKILTDTLVKTMVEPRRRCFTLPSKNLRKHAVGGILSVTIVSVSQIIGLKGCLSNKLWTSGSNSAGGDSDRKHLQTFIEIGLGELTRRTDVQQGPDPKWNATFNMVLHDNTGILKFHLYELALVNVSHGCIASCEIKFRYVEDDSTIFWAIGHESSILANHVEHCGKEVEMIVPFEGNKEGSVTVRLVLKEWLFSDGAASSNKEPNVSSRQFIDGSPTFEPLTGRKLHITVMEGQNLLAKEKSGKCDPYVKLQYGKTTHITRTILNDRNPVWSQKFEFGEVEGEHLKIKCYSADTFTDDFIGSVHCNLEGLKDELLRDVWIPLEKVGTGELRIHIQAASIDDLEGSQSLKLGTGSGLIELVLVEARDLVAADLSGTSDPFVVVKFGDIKRRTRVIYKTLNPKWNQTLEFPDNGNKLALHVKDHNAILPTSNIGDCEVEYQELPPNQTADKWIPLQGVSTGEIRVLVTKRYLEVEEERNGISKDSTSSKVIQISNQLRELVLKSRELVEDGDFEGFKSALKELEYVENIQEEYMLQLERENALLLSRISDLVLAISDSLSASSVRRAISA